MIVFLYLVVLETTRGWETFWAYGYLDIYWRQHCDEKVDPILHIHYCNLDDFYKCEFDCKC